MWGRAERALSRIVVHWKQSCQYLHNADAPTHRVTYDQVVDLDVGDAGNGNAEGHADWAGAEFQCA